MDSRLVVKRAGVPTTGTTFVISSEEPDLVGDVIVQSGMRPVSDRVPAQIDHSGKMADVIGHWQGFRIEGSKTLADLHLLDPGVSKAADLVRAMMDAGLRLAASVGFMAEKVEPTGRGRGMRYLKSLLTEVSVVVTPCHPQALQLAKSFGIDLADASDDSKIERLLEVRSSIKRAKLATLQANRSLRK
jgi:hypothetical protein